MGLHRNVAEGQRWIYCFMCTFPFSQHNLHARHPQFHQILTLHLLNNIQFKPLSEALNIRFSVLIHSAQNDKELLIALPRLLHSISSVVILLVIMIEGVVLLVDFHVKKV